MPPMKSTCISRVVHRSHAYPCIHSWDNSTAGNPKILLEHSQIFLPINPQFLEYSLANHSDRQFVSFIVQGLSRGFRIGFNPTLTHLQPAQSNLHSAALHPRVISQYLDWGVEMGRIAELKRKRPTPSQRLQVSPLGVVPKKGKPNKWKMIMDLSSPEGHNINMALPKRIAASTTHPSLRQ